MFNATDAAVDIAHGYADVHITETGSDIYDAPVYLFTETGSYLGRMQRTDSAGMARFLIPAGAYKFRVDCNGTQYWSDVINVLADEETAVDLALDLLAMDLTNDPDPVRYDGTPPALEREPVFLASLFDITGYLVQKVFADTGDDDAVYYYINDHLGTPQIIIDESNNIVWKGDYQPFGSVDAVVSDLGNNFRFAGQYYDSETGLYYNYHRYYDPKTGRYLRVDPIGLTGGINLYAYVQNNPVNYIDPKGEFAFVPVVVVILKGWAMMEAIDFVTKNYYEKQIYDELENQRQFLLEQISETDPNNLKREQILMDAYKKVILHQAEIAIVAGIDIMKEFTDRVVKSTKLCE